MKERVLHVHVGEPESEMRDRTLAFARALDAGQDIEPHIEIGFSLTEQLLSVFTPERWRLVGTLRESGPLTIAELSRRLGRYYRNVHADCKRLEEWYVVERDELGRVSVPWEEVRVDIHLPGVAVHHEMQRLDSDYERYLQQLNEAARQVRSESNPNNWLDDKALHDEYGLPR